ncbi:hypothetical protein CYY_008904 [Polysphondylium violaceum]|uniref:SHSP domain-containing protein n=1 Tax=Polysphondylium violaceum TaxID=133409 RepID=A0A8J4UPV5_9MYCE|nr:hypothetical protein CYY_008904 [Polysphondylium violaceum]
MELLKQLQQQQSSNCGNGNQQYCKRKQQLQTYSTPLNVIETKENVIVEAELVGVPKENISIEIKDNQLVITAEKKQSRYGDQQEQSLKVQELEQDKASIEEYDENNSNENREKELNNNSKEDDESEIIYHCVERKYGIFKRVLDLSRLHSLDISNIKASHNNGLLTITIPKDTRLGSLTINIQ